MPKALRRRRAHARAAFLSEYWDWMGAQVQKSLLPSGRPVAPACVLVTHYTVATEADATALRAWVASQTEDYVQVEVKPSDEYRSRVVTATETRLVTSALAVEWVQSMRRVCEQFPARPVAWGVIWGGSPPTPTPAHAARG